MRDAGIAGIHLDTMRCTRATRHARDVSNSPRLRIPPSMLKPSPLHGMQLDRWFPPYPVATGDEWPSDATLADGFSRRMPVGLLWQYAMDERLWKVDAETSIDPIVALGRGARELAGTDTSFAGLIVPNWIRQSQQQVLLDSLSGSGVKWFLVWRPIAAATEWLSRFSIAPPVTKTRMCVGKLFVIHMGFFECEFTVVEIVAEPVNGGVTLLPARLRPDKKQDFQVGTLSDSLLNRVAEVQNVSADASSVWKQIWATPWLCRQLDALSRREQKPRAKCPDCWDPQAISLTNRPSPVVVRSSGVDWRVKSLSEINDWVQKKLLDSGPAEGAVVTGELSSLWYGTIGRSLVDRVVHQNRVLVSGHDRSSELLSAGAEKQCSLLAQSAPAYLTKLPLLRTVVSRVGEPEWISLLADDDAYVLGGRKWARPQPVRGIRILGSKVLKLAIDHEDFEDVREALIDIPDAFTPNQEAELLVEITPAQGNAKIEVATIPRVKTNSPLTANLQKMEAVLNDKNEPLTPPGYLDWCPRVVPPLLPRLSSPSAWRNTVEQRILPLLKHDPSHWDTWHLRRLKEALLQKRNSSGNGRNITAIGSDGTVLEYEQELIELIEKAVRVLGSPDRDHRSTAMRMIAYTSSDLQVVQDLALSLVKSGPTKDEEYRLIGNCLRSSRGISDFFKSCTSRRINRNEIRTIAELASYRATALEFVDSETLEQIYDVISDEFRREACLKKLRLHFRYLTLCVAFLLRRRIFDDSFIPSDGELASRVKTVCEGVIRDKQRGKIYIMGGAVDLPAIMRQLIEYVDREGHGAFVLAT